MTAYAHAEKGAPTHRMRRKLLPHSCDSEASGMKTFSSQEDAQADIDFNNSCHEFCVVNTKNGQMFAIDGVGETEASTVGLILFQLANW